MHDEDCSLDTFEMTSSTNELMKEFIKQKSRQLDLNDISVYYNGGRSISQCSLLLPLLFTKS